MKLLFAADGDPHDANFWSGIPRSMHRALQEAGCEVDLCAPLNDRAKYLYFFEKLTNRLWDREFLWNRGPWTLRSLARQIRRRLAAGSYDVVFSPGSVPVSLLDCDVPIVIWTDAVLPVVINYYPGAMSKLSHRSKELALRQEREALRRAALGVFSSRWAADGARQYYRVEEDRLLVLPFGSNILNEPKADEVARMVAARHFDVCRLLFIGVEWERKGGPIAVEVARTLIERGIPTELTIIGAPGLRQESFPSFVRYLGFISKNSPDGAESIIAELARAHYFILPTQAEGSAIVFAEASSFGVPVLATRTGGVDAMVDPSRNGWLFEPVTPPTAYADVLAASFSNPAGYRVRALEAYAHYRDKLAWEVNVRRLIARMKEMIG